LQQASPAAAACRHCSRVLRCAVSTQCTLLMLAALSASPRQTAPPPARRRSAGCGAQRPRLVSRSAPEGGRMDGRGEVHLFVIICKLALANADALRRHARSWAAPPSRWLQPGSFSTRPARAATTTNLLCKVKHHGQLRLRVVHLPPQRRRLQQEGSWGEMRGRVGVGRLQPSAVHGSVINRLWRNAQSDV